MFKTYGNDFFNYPKNSGIYLIRCLVNGKVYVGSAYNFHIRWRTHIGTLSKNKWEYTSPRLQNAWNKYDAKNFIFIVLEILPKDDLILEKRENYWIKYYDSLNPIRGYNLKEAGRRGKLSEESKKRISISNSNKKQSQEVRLKRSKSLKSFYEFNDTIEYCSRPGESNGRAKLTDDQVLEIWRKGLTAKEIREQYDIGYSQSYKLSGKKTRTYLLNKI